MHLCDLNVNPKSKPVKHKIGVLGTPNEVSEVQNSTFDLQE